MTVASRSDVGMRRTNNQDSLYVTRTFSLDRWQARGHLYVVADGMGAHAAGELASQMAVEGVSHLYYKYRDQPPADALARAVRETNTEIYRRGESNSDFRQMGTTCSALVLSPMGAWLAHVGDSRIYRLRGTTYDQLTFDHSLQWEARAATPPGRSTEFSLSIPKNVITRSVGPQAHVEIDLEGPLPFQVGDTFLLCSDGLSGQIADEEQAAILATMEPDEAVALLVDLANLRGGPDNSTVIIVRVDELRATSAASPSASTSSPWRPLAWAGLGGAGLGVLLGAMLLTAALLAGGLFVIAVSLVVAILAVLVLIGRLPPATSASPTRPVNRHGKGPYMSCQATPPGELADRLTHLVDQLRHSASLESLAINWKHLEALAGQSRQEQSAGQGPQSLRTAAEMLRFLLDEIRDQRNRSQSSSVDVF